MSNFREKRGNGFRVQEDDESAVEIFSIEGNADEKPNESSLVDW